MKSNFLKVALEAVKNSEKIINYYYKSTVRAKLKADQSPVTLADIGAEKIIIQTIKKYFPDHGFFGEESGSTQGNATYTWIIDPIDGTKNYLRKIPLFATQLALMKGDTLVLGVSNAPALGELMYAEKGRGAYLNGKRVHVSQIKTLDQSGVSFGGLNLFDKHGLVNNLLSLLKEVRMRRGIGDAWSYHLLAQGKIDVMVEGDVKIWDIAALKVIVEEAGGKMTDIKGNPITMSSTSVIATNKLLHKKVVPHF